VSRNFSRPILAANIGTLRLWLWDRNRYHYKQLRITPSYAHSVRGSTYADNFVGINFQLVEWARAEEVFSLQNIYGYLTPFNLY
jgi:hypothetical protein